MSTPFLGQLKLVAFNFPPKGWAFCNGQTLSIAQNAALFSLIGTTYGGNGTTTFALPNLQDRVPVHVGSGLVLGQAAGSQNIQLNNSQMPQHSHPLMAVSGAATQPSPTNNLLAETPIKGMGSIYGAAPDGTSADPAVLSLAGGSQPHTNSQPFLTLNFIIALAGIFPSPG